MTDSVTIRNGSDPRPAAVRERRKPTAELLRLRSAMQYTSAERQFSQFVQERMYRLLRGDENSLVLMRRYAGDRGAVSFFMPHRIRRADIRPEVAETIIRGVLQFLDPFSPGGPVAQEAADGRLIETQTFPTQYPHIVVERTDVFDAQSRVVLHAEWRAVRLQNQRKSTLINRALDIGNLALEIARFTCAP